MSRLTENKSAGYTPLNQDDQAEPVEVEATPVASKRWIPKRWYRMLRLFILAVILLSLGFGVCRYYWGRSFPGFVFGATSCCGGAFNYNTFYGIPAVLPIVPSSVLVNHTELDLQTGFVVSSVPTTRKFEFNITQALTAPDGFQKPMILINNQFPGLLYIINPDAFRLTSVPKDL